MDPESKKLLDENLRISRETKELLEKIWSAQKWARFFRIFYWVLILGAAVGAYYYLEPYLKSVLGLYDGLLSNIEKVQQTTQSLPDAQSIQNLLNNLRR